MADLIICTNDELTALANAVRSKTGKTDTFSIGELTAEINEISGGGDTSVEDALLQGTISSYTNDRVTGVKDYAFVNCTNLTDINMPNATTIGMSAFCSCTNLTNTSFPSCTLVSQSAFAVCTGLTNASFPKCETVGWGAFYSCANLTTISFPECTNIDEMAFYYCSALTSADFPKCSNITRRAFFSCSSLTNANFPMCETMGDTAFYSCPQLQSVNFPMCKTIGSSAFISCRSLISASFPMCSRIEMNAFYNCISLTTADFPECTSVDRSVFASCYSLATANFPMLQTVGSSMFLKCSSLQSINLPACTQIYSSAFTGCSNLTSVTLGASQRCTLSHSYAFYGTPMRTSGYFYVPIALYNSYVAATDWSYYSSRFTFLESFGFAAIDDENILTNTTTNMSTTLYLKDGVSTPTVTVDSDNSSIATISNVVTTTDSVSFDVVTYGVEGSTVITLTATDGSETQTQTFNVTVWETIPTPEYTVAFLDESTYGFELNDSGYYESNNQGVSSSYAICRVDIISPLACTMYVDCINYAESSYDYGVLSNLNATLELRNDISYDSANIYQSFKSMQSADVQTVTYDVPAGEHYIYVKYIKDSSSDSGNDSLQFKIRFE